jgi:hypothetical protein
MIPSTVSNQGFTYAMTSVSFDYCLTLRVHLNRAVTARSNCTLMFVCNKTSIAGWGFWLRDAGRGSQNGLPKSPELPKLRIEKPENARSWRIIACAIRITGK